MNSAPTLVHEKALWVDFAQKLGVSIITVHTFSVLTILLLAIYVKDSVTRAGLWDLLRLCVPIFGTYLVSILFWFGQLRASRRTITRMQMIAFGIPIAAVSIVLLVTPVLFVANKSLEPDFVKNLFTGVELAFGAALATIARIFFEYNPGDQAP